MPRQGWSQDHLRRHLGVGMNRVYEWEKGRGRPGPKSMEKIEKWMSGEEQPLCFCESV